MRPDLNIPARLVCPITQDLMAEPVMAKDGRTYERAAIQEWVEKNGTSPMGRQPIKAKFTDNYDKRSEVDEFVTKHRRQYEAALIQSVQQNEPKDVEYLLKLGINPNCKDKQNFTPFQHACRLGYNNIMTLLLSFQAKANNEVEPPAELNIKPNTAKQFIAQLQQNHKVLQQVTLSKLSLIQAAMEWCIKQLDEQTVLANNLQKAANQLSEYKNQATVPDQLYTRYINLFFDLHELESNFPGYREGDKDNYRKGMDRINAEIQKEVNMCKQKVSDFNKALRDLNKTYQLGLENKDYLVWSNETISRKVQPKGYSEPISMGGVVYKGLLEDTTWSVVYNKYFGAVQTKVNAYQAHSQLLKSLSQEYQKQADSSLQYTHQIQNQYTTLQQKLNQSIQQGLTQLEHLATPLQQLYQAEQLLTDVQQQLLKLFEQPAMAFDVNATESVQAEQVKYQAEKLGEMEEVWTKLQKQLMELESTWLKCDTKSDILKCQGIHLAAYTGQLEVLQSLLEKGITADISDTQGQSPLAYAIKGKQLETAQLLLKKGAKPHLQDSRGNTFLHIAAQFNSIEIAKLLIAQGVSYKQPNHAGLTPAQVAMQQGNFDLAILLQTLGSSYMQTYFQQQNLILENQVSSLQKQMDALQQQFNRMLTKPDNIALSKNAISSNDVPTREVMAINRNPTVQRFSPFWQAFDKQPTEEETTSNNTKDSQSKTSGL